MDHKLLDESFRRALFRVVSLIDPDALESESIPALRHRYDKAIQIQSTERVATGLALSRVEVEQFLTPRVRAASSSEKQNQGAEVPGQGLAKLRALVWLEIVLTRKLKSKPNLLKADVPEELARRELRALELVLRAFITEQYEGQSALIERLRTLFKLKAVDDWLANAEPGSILTGTLFSDLASIFTHREEWPRYREIYSGSQALAYLKSNREVIRSYLDDIRFIRNSVAHHKDLSAVEIELLNLYYGQLVDPIQRLFEAGRTRVDPRSVLEVNPSTLETYFSSLRRDVEDLGQRTQEIERDLKTVHEEVGTINRRTQRTHISVAAVLVLLLAGGSLLVYAILRIRSSIAHDYKSLGWLTLSSSVEGTNVSLQGEAWMGNQQVSFGSAKLRTVARRGNEILARSDLSSRFDPRQVGGQSPISFDVPTRTDSVTTCFSIWSSKLEGTYTVIQKFGLRPGSSMADLPSIANEQVVKGEATPCPP
jgi:hypothetical protein